MTAGASATAAKSGLDAAEDPAGLSREDARRALLADDLGEDGVAVLNAASVDELHVLLLSGGPRRRMTIDAELAFRALHADNGDALTTARLLLTDRRWERLASRLVRGLLRAELLTQDELDLLARELLASARLAVHLDGRLFEGGPTFELETDRVVRPHPQRRTRRRNIDPVIADRTIQPTLRRWAAEYATRRGLLSLGELYERLGALPSKDGAAGMLGVLDAVDALDPVDATDLIEHALAHRSGRVRTAALLLLTQAGQGERAAVLAADDRDGGVHRALAPRPPEPIAETLF